MTGDSFEDRVRQAEESLNGGMSRREAWVRYGVLAVRQAELQIERESKGSAEEKERQGGWSGDGC